MAKFPGYQRDFKFTNELEETRVIMLLSLPLGSDDQCCEPCVIGQFFAEEMYFWHKNNFKILVKINCPGGRVFDGFPIMDAMLECEADTQIIGISASMSVPVSVSGKKRTAYNYAKMMIHPVSGGTKPNEKMAVDMMANAIKQVLLNRSKLTESQIDEMLKQGAKDTWLTAEQMLQYGLIDEIIDTELMLMGDEKDPYALYKVYNKLNEEQMAKPELQGDALQAIQDIQNKLDSSNTAIQAKDSEIATLKAKIEAYELTQKTEKENAAKAKVEVAIKNKQITIPVEKPELKDQFVKMAMDAPDAFNALVESKPAPRSSVVTHIQNNGGGQGDEETYESLANFNPKKLYDMMDSEPEAYNKLLAKWQEKQKNQKIV